MVKKSKPTSAKMIRGYAAMMPGCKVESFAYEPGRLGADDVEIAISHCGICHSDIHLIHNDWGISVYPLVPGHEIVGNIIAIGANVTHLAVGQYVGVGWQRASCLDCEWCMQGDENLCTQSQATCIGNYGGFAERICTDGRFVFPLPIAMAPETAAPLLCGGITVYTPLRHYQVTAGMKVGIVGIGGLGHLAIQFCRAWGCEITAFSSSPDKEEEARQLGAHHFISSIDNEILEKRHASLDFILVTVNVDLDWYNYISMLRPNGRLCFVGVPESEVTIPVFSLILGRKTICGSPIGGRAMMRDMLHFAALHRITAKVEVMPLKQVNSALSKVRSNLARYRIVLAI